MKTIAFTGALAIGCAGIAVSQDTAEPIFYRGINLNGPAVTIDGQAWESSERAPGFAASGKTFANQNVPLKPPTDAARTEMIRSSVWGSEVDLEFRQMPAGIFQVFLYVWEDNNNEVFDVQVNGRPVQKDFHSGSAGAWIKLGPWRVASEQGKLRIGSRRGAANLSGIEIWQGDGEIPGPPGFRFVESPDPDQAAFFERSIRPLLAEHCYECHSADAKKLKGGLLLDSRAGVRKGGDTGPSVAPGDPDASLLVLALRRSREGLAMPPDGPLPPEAIADIETWVKMGAPDPRDTDTVAMVRERDAVAWEQARKWWSFRPLADPAPPTVTDTAWPVSEIDRYLLTRLESEGLKPAADADRRTLIRRATYDLTGLPPTPEEITEFLADPAPDAEAFSRVVDRLLESPRYGERWGRHWLDVVRYADTAGDNSDYPIPQMHRYRDWVIDAFNRDLPYDAFVADQLAGDLRGGANDDERNARLIATGYLANARRFGSRVDDYPWHLTIEDTIDNFGRGFLGLTLSCSRCHDHKFDPITTRDYYALYGIFESTRYPWPGIELDKRQRDLVPMVAPEKRAPAETELAKWQQERKRLEKEAEKLSADAKKAKGDDKKKLEDRLASARKAVSELQKKAPRFEMAYAVSEAAETGDAALQQKGDPAKPGPVVPRRWLELFGGASLAEEPSASGRDKLAERIFADGGALPARVMANRIWQHHFGRGLVSTPNDFGHQGRAPSHPELLDFLARRFREDGWSVKSMHRLVMNSRAYRMSSERSPEALARDPGNELLAGFPQQRLDAESIRDTLLFVAGTLDLSPAGAHPFPPEHEWTFTQHKPFKAVYETDRRSVYLMTQRIQRHPYLAIFDGADPSTSTPARPTSTTPLQALYWLNDPFVHRQADLIASRISEDVPDPVTEEEEEDLDDARLVHCWELLLGRPPELSESADAARFLAEARARLISQGLPAPVAEEESWRALVRSLLRLNEFVYLG